MVALKDLIARSDFITLHAAPSPENNKMLDADAFARMKPTAYVVNTGRGSLIDYPALRTALVTRQIAGAALDVFDTEPPRTDDPLFRYPNVICTPCRGLDERGRRRHRLARGAQSLGDDQRGRPRGHRQPRRQTGRTMTERADAVLAGDARKLQAVVIASPRLAMTAPSIDLAQSTHRAPASFDQFQTEPGRDCADRSSRDEQSHSSAAPRRATVARHRIGASPSCQS